MKITATLTAIICLNSCATQYAEGPCGEKIMNSTMGGRTQATCSFASFNTDHNDSFKEFGALAKAAVWGSVAKSAIKGWTSTANTASKTASKTALGKTQSNNSAGVANTASNNALSASKDLNKTDLGILKDNNKTSVLLKGIEAAVE